MMNLLQRNLFVPRTSLNQQMVIPTCRRIASRLQCYLSMYFKKNDKKKTSCSLICLCFISLQISSFFFYFSFLVSTYIKCFDIPFFREKFELKETLLDLIRKMISEFFSVQSDENCFSIVSCVCLFFISSNLDFLRKPWQDPSKN